MDQQTVPSRFRKKKLSFRLLMITLLWSLFLLVSTWTSSLEQFLDFQAIDFRWNWHPDFAVFFYFGDFTLVHEDYVAVKLGHFMGFAVLDLLLFTLVKNHRLAIVISFVFAFLTEFLQLFLERDGRLYDLGIDTFGIVSVYALVVVRNGLRRML